MPTASAIERNKIAKAAIAAFFIFLTADLVFVGCSLPDPRYITKPLIVASLMVYAVVKIIKTQQPVFSLLLAALFFSWLGDILLMFDSFDAGFFLYGLSAFLISHIFYSFLFYRLLKAERIRMRPVWVLVAAVYYAMLMALLFSRLGSMKIPVLVYGVVICLMLVLALHLGAAGSREAGWRIMTGAVLFVVSDSILAFNKFHTSFFPAALLVMLTYGMAQYYLTTGVCRYAESREPVI
ncbi:MAG TPA: lysoplasmalogenase [Chitinophagaceae bacterium]|nr:lysoplasmalogenase [Chitinophagaceae bacterium]